MSRFTILTLCLCLALSVAGCAPETPKLDTPEGSYDQEFNAKIVNLGEGETAYYTLDGSEPTEKSNLYTEEGIIFTEGSNLVKIISFNPKGKTSEVLTASFTVTPQKPQMDIPDGVYDEEFTVKIVNLKKGYRAYYTLDGTEPSFSSTLYTDAGIPISEGENQVKVIKFDAEKNCSEILTANFTVLIQTPRLATPDGVYNAEFAAKIVNLQEGYRAYYTLDGSEPDENSKLYSEVGIPLTEGENQVKIIKYDESGNHSDVLTANLSINPYEPDYSNEFAMLHKHGDTLYYVQFVGGPSYAFVLNSLLCSYNLANDSSDVVLDKDMCGFIFRDGIIYYDFSEVICEGQIYRSNMYEENSQEVLNYDGLVDSFSGFLIDDWLYYATDFEPYMFCRTNVKSLITEKLSETEVWALGSVVNRDIYYFNREFNLYRYNIDTFESTQVSSDRTMNIKEFGDGYIYYYSAEPVSCVYRIRPDGTGKELVPGPSNREYVVVGDRIYYGDSRGLQSIRVDGEDHKTICSHVPSNLQHYRGKLFFNGSSRDKYHLYCLDLATDEVTLLLERGGWNLYFVDGEVYYIHTRVDEGEAGLYHLTETGLEKLAGQEE